MAKDVRAESLADVLRRAVTESGLPYNRLGKRAGVGQPVITRFMSGERDITLAVASRLCRVLGLGLTRVGPVLTEPLDRPEPTTRGRRRVVGTPPPAFTETRGRGRRVDLEGAAATATAGDGKAASREKGGGEAKAKPRRAKRAGGP
jgi:hypothetical protein